MAEILHLTHRYWPVVGGSEQYVWQIARRQAKEGHRVTVVTTNAADLAYFWDPSANSLDAGEVTDQGGGGAVAVIRVPVRHLPGAPRSFGALRLLQVRLAALPGLSALARHLGRWAPYLPELEPTLSSHGRKWELVFGWNITFDGLMTAAQSAAGESGGRFLAVPFLHLGEGADSDLRRYYTMPHQLALLRQADRVYVQTQLEGDYLSGQGISTSRQVVAGAGIEPDMLHGGDGLAFRKQHDLQGVVVACIGPQTGNKGTGHLLRAMQILWQAGRPYNLVLAGSMMRDFKAQWERFWAAEPERTHNLGPVTEAEKRDLLAAADVLVLPSRTESFGIVLLEAWFYGRPVIGARAGAIPEVIEDGRDGRLVPFGDADALAKAIVEVADDPALAKRWGASGRKKTMKRYTWDAVYERFAAALM